MANNSTTPAKTGPGAADTVGSRHPVGASLYKTLVRPILRPFASLKLTVALFSLAMLLILIGTLAQAEQDMWEVVNTYFRSYYCWVPVNVFFPDAFFPNLKTISGSFLFPGGATIGMLMVINLLSAHLVRFQIQAKGSRLALGLGILAAGCGITYLVIASGHNKEGLQGLPMFEWGTLWLIIKVALFALWLVTAFAFATIGRERKLEQWLLLGSAVGLGALLAWLLYRGNEAALGASSMRILWQLIQGGLAGAVLLAGCILVFKRRAGVVLLHAGVGLMMFGEVQVGRHAVEEMMTIYEGETASFVHDIRTTEIAVVDTSDDKVNRVVAIPQGRWKQNQPLSVEQLPFTIEVVKFFKNHDLRRVTEEGAEDNPATAGIGTEFEAVTARASAGADASSEVDLAAAYVKLADKETGKELGTYLLSQYLAEMGTPERVDFDGKLYELNLRYKRTYKPYSMTLLDVRKDDYLGTSTPRNYSSDIRLVDESRNIDREVHIWMNNPLRYAGETFYQSEYRQTEFGERTSLQVVRNRGWMIPYVACMIVFWGLFYHFGLTLLRFLRRRAEGTQRTANVDDGPDAAGKEDSSKVRQESSRKYKKQPAPVPTTTPPSETTLWTQVVGPAVVVALAAVVVLYMAREPSPREGDFDFVDAATIPVVYEGRTKPLDTLARNSLKVISEKQTFKDTKGNSQPAIQWLFDVIANVPEAREYEIFRITNDEVRNTFELPHRKGYRYSVGELQEHIGEFEKQINEARKLDRADLTMYQRKLLDLDNRIRTYLMLVTTFSPPPLPPIPTEQSDPSQVDQMIEQFREAAVAHTQQIQRLQGPLAVPFRGEQADDRSEASEDVWHPFAIAWILDVTKTRILGLEPNPATLSWQKMLVAYRDGDAIEFNGEVDKYLGRLSRNPPSQLNMDVTRFEAFFNRFAPFLQASIFYLAAFILAAIGWLAWPRMMNNTAFWLIVFTFVLHTFALIGRIYISGRPPVTNLYSSAVFIGWGIVLLGIVLELLYKMGVGNVIASCFGFLTLLIAHGLSMDGDTFTVLQAVLDTQFWLSTHVVCITLGYSTTFLAGGLGIAYILRGWLTPTLTEPVRRDLSRMIYGTVCFAIFFSFIGTVLGGLWADDSWGRFWGWDPKENGALLIVLWNAIVLHARWDGMIKDRGLAVLAVGGNIVTAWSWFGTNELGIGLHSYGFTEGRLNKLGIAVAVHLIIILLGCLPKDLWWSFRRDDLHNMKKVTRKTP